MIKKSDFYYDLPEILIAQHPLDKRDQSRLMVLNRDSYEPEHALFSDLSAYLRPGDCLVVNNTRVIPARLMGVKRESAIAVEFLLLNRREADLWEVMVRPGRRLKTGHWVDFIPDKLSAEVLDVLPGGNRLVRFSYKGVWEEILDEAGLMPLPPYIHEQLEDKERYQTVYASNSGSAAAPTAGLHFTKELLASLRDRQINVAELTLHVGIGTFRPVKTENILDHVMHSEYYELPEKAVEIISRTKANGKRVIAVGTTSCRVLEAVASENHGVLRAKKGWTDIFIYPGYSFKLIDGLITNFHLPESTLLMLVSALGGKDRLMNAYARAIEEEYRFFSFGDAMLILPFSAKA